MTTLEITPGSPLHGTVRVPGDKSISHRALLLAARADGTSTVRGLSAGEDVGWTAKAIETLGASVERAGRHEIRITGGAQRLHEPATPIYVGNSGTAIRLLAGYVAAYPWLTVLHGDESVASRPMDRVVAPLRRMGAKIDGRESGKLSPLSIRGGRLTGIDFRLPVASAQVKSAVLLAGLGATTPTTVHEPAPTRAHTEEMLRNCGADVNVSEDARTITIRPSHLRPFELEIPGDPSQAAFWIVAACVVPGSDITIPNVYVGRARAGFLDVLRRMGANVDVTMRDATTADLRARFGELSATTVAGEEIPALIDEIPALAVASAFAVGTTVFRDAGELAVKETNRIDTITSELRALGARAEPRPDGLSVIGSGPGGLTGGEVQAHGDHRVAMAMAVAALAAEGPTRVEGWEAVATSYPAFAADLERLRQ